MAAQNDLLASGWSENGWKYKGHNASALPQIEDPVLLGLPAQDEGTRFSSFYVLKEEIMENFCVWVQKSDGTFQTNLHYFNLDTFPKTVKEAREKLSNPPEIPTGTLSAKKIQFTTGENMKYTKDQTKSMVGLVVAKRLSAQMIRYKSLTKKMAEF